MSVRNLQYLFAPRSVAVVGASDRPFSVGAVVLKNLKQGAFAGSIWPVNRRHAQVDGAAAWPDVDALPATPDLAVICIPAAGVPEVIEALGRKGTRAAIVISAGFARESRNTKTSTEIRNAVGEPVSEVSLLEAARPHLLRVLGPNCIGLLVPPLGLNASFAPGDARAGGIAFVTQSGALATAMLDWAGARGIGFSHFISLGDSADVDFGDALDYLASDPGTRAVLMYMESVKSARKFMSAARAASRNKPVIVVKAGRAPEGARAAASHTGALAGSDAVFDAAMRRAGVLRVDTLESLFDAAETLAHAPRWIGKRLVILTNGGGAGVLAADALALGGGLLANLGAPTLDALERCLPATWSGGNPVDIVGDAPVRRYVDALQALLAAPEVDGVLFMHAPTAIVAADAIAAACLPLICAAAKPVLACWLGGASVAHADASTSAAGLPRYATPERAVAGWLQLQARADSRVALDQLTPDRLDGFVPARDAARTLIECARKNRHEWLAPAECRALLTAYGIATPDTRVAADAAAATRAADAIGYPVALKIISPHIIHKSDVGGVALGLATAAAVENAVADMRTRVAHAHPTARIDGFTVQAMAAVDAGRELIVGVADDPVFGPAMLFGEGGIAVELRSGHALALPPLNAALARDLIKRSGLAPLLAAHRGRPAADEVALIDVLTRVSQLICDMPEIVEFDINPLVAGPAGAIALDARFRLRLDGQAADRLSIRPYPSVLEEQLSWGTTEVLLRPIRPEDAGRLQAFYAGAPAQDLRTRFFASRAGVSPSELARRTQIDYDREMTFVALDAGRTGGASPILGEVQVVCDPDHRRAEFAVHVADSSQGRGLGHLLLDKAVRYLKADGVEEFTGECLRENLAMATLARRVGFAVTADDAAADTFAFRLKLQ